VVFRQLVFQTAGVQTTLNRVSSDGIRREESGIKIVLEDESRRINWSSRTTD
jgi:hypothetical protein